MKTCLVSLVSDQTIPNILVACHFKADFLLFINTAAMEQKRKVYAILEAMRQHDPSYSPAHATITVLQDSINDLQAKVFDWHARLEEEYRFIVNLTGGTKLMSIAAYNLFRDFESEMIYVPIPKNEYLTAFPKRRSDSAVPLKDRLTVAEYLTAYGFQITNRDRIEENRALAEKRRELTALVFDNYLDIRPLLAWIGQLLRPLKANKVRRGHTLSGEFTLQNESQKRLLTQLGFQMQGAAISKTIHLTDWNYLRGGWLEEHLYLALREALPRGTDIQMGMEARGMRNEIESKASGGNNNEFDVLFTYDNTLCLVECKSLSSPVGNEHELKGTITEFLYKLGALRQNFGLTPRAFLATTSEEVLTSDGNIKPHLAERARQFGIRIIPLLKIHDLINYFRENL